MPDVTPLPRHYTGLLAELTEGLRCVLSALDWHEGINAHHLPHFDAADRQRAEVSNLIGARTHVANVLLALDREVDGLRVGVLAAEHATMERVAPIIAETIRATDPATLPPELRSEGT